MSSSIVYVATPADTAINVTSDATIVSTSVTVAAGDQLIVDAWFHILNNSTATRVITITLDFGASVFDIELATGALAFSATLMQPLHLYGVLDVRTSSLAYMEVMIEGQLAAGIASGTDTTMAATHLEAKGWGSYAGNLTGSCAVLLKARSASTTATQTLYLHNFVVRKATPG